MDKTRWEDVPIDTEAIDVGEVLGSA